MDNTDSIQVFEKETGTFERILVSSDKTFDPDDDEGFIGDFHYMGMAISEDGTLWVCDGSNDRIRIFE